MTFFGLARKNVGRKPLRTTLLMVCVAVAFLIYGVTSSFQAGSQSASAASEDILGVMSAGGRAQALPMAHRARIAAEPDVGAVGYVARMRGFSGREKNVIAVSAVEPQALMAVNGKELGLTPALIEALDAGRDRVLVGRALAEAQGWSVGQHIGVTAFQMARLDGSHDWRFEIAGIFDGESASTDTYFIIAQYDYVNAARAKGKDMVDAFVVRPRDGVKANVLATHIDALFANSIAPTRTQSEKQFLEAFLRQYADIGLIVDLITGAAFITLLLIVINTMVFAVRERTFEIGLLKTLGVPGPRIMALVLGETLFIFVAGAGAGLALAKLATVLAGPALGLVFSPLVLAKAALIGLVLGLATGLLPAVNAVRTPIIKAFRAR